MGIDRDFERAQQNKEYKYIIYKVARKYRGLIRRDEIEQCKKIGLWTALRKFDEDAGSKFTTFLYNSIDWECKRFIRDNKRFSTIGIGFRIEGRKPTEVSLETREMLDKLDKKEADAICMKFFENKTFIQIAKEKNLSRDTVSIYVKNGLAKMAQM